MSAWEGSAWQKTRERLAMTVEHPSHVERGLRYPNDVAELTALVEQLRRENSQLTDQLTSVQARCTELLLVGRELRPLAERLAAARAKHPRGCNLGALLEEAGEVARAIRREGEERVREELLDTAAVAMRLYAGEWFARQVSA